MTGARAFRPLLPLFGLDVLTAFTVGMVPPLLPLLVADWGLPTAQAGLVNAVYASGRLVGSFPASWLRARRGPGTAVGAGIGVLILGVVTCGLARGFPVFLGGRLLMGLGASAAVLAIFAEFLEATPPAWRGRLSNLFEGLAILSIGTGGAVGAVLAGRFGWRPVFVGAGPILALAFGLCPLLSPATDRRGGGESGIAPGAGAPSWRRLAPVHAASLALSLTWTGLFATLAPLLGSARYHLASGALGLAQGAGYLAELAGLLAIGLVIDRVRREPLFAGGAASVAAGGLLLALGASTGTFVLAMALVGLGFAVWTIPATVLADRVGTPLPPRVVATYRVAIDVGMISGPLVLGTLASLLGDRLAAGAAGLVLVAGALVLWRR